VGLSTATLIPRKTAMESLDRAILLSPQKNKELIYVHGLEGNGRRTAIRQFMKLNFSHLTERTLALDSLDNPEDLLLRLLEASGATKRSAEAVLKKARDGASTATKEIRKIIHDARDNKSYYVVAVDKFTALDAVILPEWIPQVFDPFREGPAPLLFIVTSTVLTDRFLRSEPRPTVVRINGLDETEGAVLMERLCERDPQPARWTAAVKQKVLDSSHASPALCQLIMLALGSEPSLSFLEQVATREVEAFGSGISLLAGYFIQHLQGSQKDILALRVIERLGITSKAALDQIFGVDAETAAREETEVDLFRLRESGLIEQLSPDVFRIPPLLQRRLGDVLWNKGVDSAVDQLFMRFAQRVPLATDEYGPIYATNVQTARLRTHGDVAPELDLYLTVAMLLKAGLERYSQNEYSVALKTLQLAMNRIHAAADIVDLDTQVEIARYFGLAAAREREYGDVMSACHFLEHRFADTLRAKQGRAMGEFLRGFELRIQSDYNEAISHFENAKELLRGIKHVDRQRGAVLTELSRAWLYRHPPNYNKAVDAAEEAYTAKKVTLNLNGLIRARIARAFSKSVRNTPAFDAELKEIKDLLGALKSMTKGAGQDIYFMREAEMDRMAALQSRARPLSLTRPIWLVDQALKLKRRDDNLIEKWVLCLFDQSEDHAAYLFQQTDAILARRSAYRPKLVSAALKVLIAITARDNQHTASLLIERNREFLQGWTFRLLESIVQNKGELKRDVDGFGEFLRA
jgi:tetratricopeptide (TPR) repeat protein